jgi:hypothetical protein
MDFINEVLLTSLDEPRKEVSAEVLNEICDEFAIQVSYDEDEAHAYLLVQFGVGGPA